MATVFRTGRRWDAVLLACVTIRCGGGEQATPGDAGGGDAGLRDSGGPDADSDSDVDADSDTDSDADSDTDTDAVGLCLPDVEAGTWTEQLGAAAARVAYGCGYEVCDNCYYFGTRCAGVEDPENERWIDCEDEANADLCDYEGCVDRCIRANEDDDPDKRLVNESGVSARCLDCYLAIAPCIMDDCAGNCRRSECDCDLCQCALGCDEEFAMCSGLLPYLDCLDPDSCR